MHFRVMTAVQIPGCETMEHDELEKSISTAVSNILDGYMSEPEAKDKYVEFVNTEEEDRDRYEEACKLGVVVWPNGTKCFVEEFRWMMHGKFYVDYPDGCSTLKVLQRYKTKRGCFGATTDNKRKGRVTKNSKRYKIIPNSSCMTFEEYEKNYMRREYDEEDEAFGEYENPNALFDYGSLGGRFGNILIAPADNKMYPIVDYFLKNITSFGIIYYDIDGNSSCVEGYNYTSAILKRDINPEKQKDELIEYCRNQYNDYCDILKEYNETGKIRSGYRVDSNSNLLSVFSDVPILLKNESFNEFTTRTIGETIINLSKYHIPDCAYIFNMDGSIYQDDEYDDKTKIENVDKFIDSLPDDAFVCILDCHM